MRIAYGKLGCVMNLGDPSNVRGDIEVQNLLSRLIADGHDVHLITPHAGESPAGVFSEWGPGGAYVGLPSLNGSDRDALCDDGPRSTARLTYYDAELTKAIVRLPVFDDWIIWLGEHNGPCWPYPKKTGTGLELIRPYGSRIRYVWPVIAALNNRGIAPLWLCPDPRNVLACNNLDPALIGRRPIIAQYHMERHRSEYIYGALELLAIAHLPTPTGPVRDRGVVPLGAMINEGSKDVRPLARANLIVPWVINIGGELIGVWRPETIERLGIRMPMSVPVANVQRTLARWTSTIALPAHTTGWVTAKVWEAFASDTVCFAHPRYDDQDHAYDWIASASVRRFLRPRDPSVLLQRVLAVHENESLRTEIIQAQRTALKNARSNYDNGAALIYDNVAF